MALIQAVEGLQATRNRTEN